MLQEMESRTLEMLAIAMSEEYGVTVLCNGQQAETSTSTDNGRTIITIPSIPIADRHYRALLRGYVDHEVGHVRFSDRALMLDGPLRCPHMAGSLKCVCHVIEDVCVEQKMGDCFPGCRRNLRSLGNLLYIEHASDILPPPLAPVDACTVLADLREGRLKERDFPYRIWEALLHYLLFAVRSRYYTKFAQRLPLFAEPLETLAPGLAAELAPLLESLDYQESSTETNLQLARRLLETVLAHFEARTAEGGLFTPQMLETLRWILRSGGPDKDRVDIARAAEMLVGEVARDIDPRLLENRLTLHNPVGSEVWEARVGELSSEEQLEALQASAKMAAQMQALLQSFELNRSGPTRTGRLNTNALHKLFICRNDLFYRRIDRRKINTEVVLCIDMSGSMHFDNKALLASKALFSLAHCLTKIRGLAFSIIGFFDNQVVDLLRKGSHVTARMRIVPDGGTLCGCALRYSLHTFSVANTPRKIVIMITDGDANDGEDFEKAIVRARESGVEFLGVGIQDDHILKYLPAEECCIILEVRELAEEILRMLRHKLGIMA